jgi:hypothetical protein
MNILNSDKPIDLRDHMLSTYQTLRVVLVLIALIFPWVLWIGGYISSHRLELQPSMSDYYHANAMTPKELAERESATRVGRQRTNVPIDSGRGVLRNWFVGVLFAISALLAVYKGFRPAEDLALNLAAVFATLVALVPTPWVDDPEPPIPFHHIFAVCFFLCIAYVCFFCAPATLSLVRKDRQPRYCRFYKGIGVAMAASPLLAVLVTQVLGLLKSYIFVAEAFAVYAFAAYWLVKTLEISETNADRRAASGELRLPAGTGPADAVRDIPVVSVAQTSS